jgi:hypothetical protein
LESVKRKWKFTCSGTSNVNSLPLQNLEEQLRLGCTEVEQEVLFGEGLDLALISSNISS